MSGAIKALAAARLGFYCHREHLLQVPRSNKSRSYGRSFWPCGLSPLNAVIHARNATAGHLHVDETSWSVLEAVAGKAQHRRLNLQSIPTSSPVLRVVGPVIHGLLDLVTPEPTTPTQVRPRPAGIHHPELPAARDLDHDVPRLARAGAKRVSPPPDVGGERDARCAPDGGHIW